MICDLDLWTSKIELLQHCDIDKIDLQIHCVIRFLCKECTIDIIVNSIANGEVCFYVERYPVKSRSKA